MISKPDFYSKFKKSLDIYPSKTYVRLLEEVQKRKDGGAAWKEQWETGVYPANMAIGATLAFREKFKHFHEMTIVVGYAGTKEIEKAQETIDIYYIWNAISGEVSEFDSLGNSQKCHDSLELLLEDLGIEMGNGEG